MKRKERRPGKPHRPSPATGGEFTVRAAFKAAVEHYQAGRPAQAERLYRKILSLQPDNAAAYNNLGIALMKQGRSDEAIACYRRALAIDPGGAETHNALGDAFKDRERLEEATASYRRALEIDPDSADTHHRLALALTGQRKLEEAAKHHAKALAINPQFVEAHHNLGNVCQDLGRPDEAIGHYRRALSLKPGLAEAHSSLGNALGHVGRLDEALHHHRQAVSIRPDYAVGHLNKSVADLLAGNYAEGWREYEWRWRAKPFFKEKRAFHQPLWDGSPLQGRTILLHVEQGLGDAIQFVRYVPLVVERGGRVLVECQPQMVRLFSAVGGVDEAIGTGDPLPAFDVYAPLMSLPHVFQTTAATIPGDVPYLAAPPGTGPGLPDCPDGTRLKVGIVWAGRATHTNDRNRSCRLRQFEPLFSVPGVAYFSLQKGDAAAELAAAAVPVTDLGDRLGDFADTAAVIDRLDLVVAVDTAVAHLAGALARPVWILIPFVADWRWLTQGEHSPWYPTARLFRQAAMGDWAPVFTRVAEGLQRESARRG